MLATSGFLTTSCRISKRRLHATPCLLAVATPDIKELAPILSGNIPSPAQCLLLKIWLLTTFAAKRVIVYQHLLIKFVYDNLCFCSDCEVCSPVETYENIVDNYCRADVVVKTRIKRLRRSELVCRKANIYKAGPSEEERRALKRPKFSLLYEAGCCSMNPSRQRYLIMGRKHGNDIIPTLIMPFKKSKPLRQAMKMFKRGLNCSDPNLITKNLEPTSLSQEPPVISEPRGRGQGRSRKGEGSNGGGSRRNKAGGGNRRRGRPNGSRRGNRRRNQRPGSESSSPVDPNLIADTIPRETSLLLSSNQPEHFSSSREFQSGQLNRIGGSNSVGDSGGGRGDNDRQGKKRRRKGNKANGRERRKKVRNEVTEQPSFFSEA
ncbi:hypothetical protein SK128_020843 [Halocaridina rubra]|uniref:NTR domain-containing protein n=1 Tax=Halocaridina rubra TaxID=373956 RepID=A0AAN8ZVH7_HALRR